MNLKSLFILLSIAMAACQSPKESETTSDEVAVEADVIQASSTADHVVEIDLPVDEDHLEMVEMTTEEIQEELTYVEEEESVEDKEKIKEELEEIANEKEEKVVEVEEREQGEKETKVKEATDGIIKGKADVIDPGLPRKDNPGAEVALLDHSDWDALLSKYVNSGIVDYSGLKKEEGKLDEYLDKLSANPIGKEWSRAEQMAYWINAYNAYTIKLILNNYPLQSIMDLDGGKPWDRKWIRLAGRTLSLNDIEHKIIRPQFQDPRIHFALNCAAKSCPPLPSQAFTATNLDKLLEERTKSFINDENYNSISENQVQVSSIFDWYGEDFGDLRNYLNKYSSAKIGDAAEIQFREYDWNLNEK